MSGEPSWESAGYQGTAEKFVIHPEIPSFQAVDQVSVLWQAPQGTATHRPPLPLTADRMIAGLGEAHFTGWSVYHPLWTVSAGELDLRLGTNSASLRNSPPASR